MSFFETTPADLDQDGPVGPLTRFRAVDERRVLQGLKALHRQETPVTIGLAHGPAFTATLWSIDSSRKQLHFNIERNVAVNPVLQQASSLWGAAYLDTDKIQFALRGVAFGGEGPRRAMHAELPNCLYRMHQRGSLRVRPSEDTAPVVRFCHPLIPDRQTLLRLVDLSKDGCALWRPMNELPLTPGMIIPGAEFEIDEQSFFFADLSVQHVHVGSLAQGERIQGMRIGCRMSGLAPKAKTLLEAWLRSGHGRLQRLSLTFD